MFDEMAEAAVRQSLADRSLQLDGLIEEEMIKERRKVSEEDAYLFIERMKNPNTQKKTEYEIRKMRQWLMENGEGRGPEEISPKDLNLYIAGMFFSLKKRNGSEYEPDSLRCMYSSIHRYLTSKNYP